MQERVESGLFKTSIEHKPVERFVINTHAFHNAHLLRATLPRSIISPVRLQEDRYSLHAQCAETFRIAKAHRVVAKAQAAAAKAQAEQMGDTITTAATEAGSRPNKRKRSTMKEAQNSRVSCATDARALGDIYEADRGCDLSPCLSGAYSEPVDYGSKFVS